MNVIFVDMIDINVIVYLDDILVYLNSLAEHIKHVWEVLHRLHSNSLFPEQINASSMSFPANTLVICYCPMAQHWLRTNYKSFMIGPNLGKSEISSLSLVL